MIDSALVDWSRLQFALTAGYHWLFVPLTLGLAIIMATMETIYVVKGDEFWKKTTKFWMKLFAINFAVGIATGLILEFEFGTNWSNYSWFVGDIFGAPLAIEGIFAFFMEATFFAIMFFGWEKVSKHTHLTATWLTGIGAAISAIWILIANSWMQHPVGMTFNPDTVRHEMTDFWALVLNPVAISKFFHSVFSGWMTASIFVIGVSSWFLLKKQETRFALSSIRIAAIIGITGTVATIISGDSSGIDAAKYQPMKLAAAEGLEDGGQQVALSLTPGVEIPGMLSILATHDINGYVPGINNILNGYITPEGDTVPSAEEKIARGKTAVNAFKAYRTLKDSNPDAAIEARQILEKNIDCFGYGYIDNPKELVPSVPLIYWAFRIMVGTGCFLLLLMIIVLWNEHKKRLADMKWLHWISLLSIPAVYIAGQAGWIVAEAGRQPWIIEGLLPVKAAVSSISVPAVQTTFFIFVAIFTLFLVIEMRIMIKAIKKGPGIETK